MITLTALDYYAILGTIALLVYMATQDSNFFDYLILVFYLWPRLLLIKTFFLLENWDIVLLSYKIKFDAWLKKVTRS